MTQPADEPTGDEVADGTQLPNDDVVELVEIGEAGVEDAGDEPWYEASDE